MGPRDDLATASELLGADRLTLAAVMPKVYSRRRGAEPPPPGAVYVGRPTQWGNPFVVPRDGAQGECVEKYREWIAEPEQEWLRYSAVQLLRGRDLVCWCAPLPCHADVLLEIANG